MTIFIKNESLIIMLYEILKYWLFQGKFTDAAYPTNTTCYVSKPCKIHHIITGSSSKKWVVDKKKIYHDTNK